MTIKAFHIIIFLLSLQCFSQHSEEFVKLTSNLKPLDTIKVDLKYGNGNQKEIGILYEYEFDGYIYSNFFGKHIQYYRDGSIAVECDYDDFGILLSSKYYYGDGNLWVSSQTLTIDTVSRNLHDIFQKSSHIIVTEIEQNYRFDSKTCEYYLKKTGNRINGKKTGVWKTFNVDGSVKKESLY